MKNSVFKSPEQRDKLRAYYSDILSRFPFGQKYVKTANGQAFVLTAGEESDPPIVLLHGSNSNSAFWFPEMAALSAQYRVYAVDIVGEAGNSDEFRPDLSTGDFALWLREVLTMLGVEKAIVIGNSLGGWVALKFAIFYPESVKKLILIASAGLAPVRRQFLQNAYNARMDDGTVPVTSEIIGAPEIPKEVLEFMNLIAQSYTPIQELPLFNDEELGKLDMPILFIDGEDDVIIDTEASILRLSHLIPSAVIQLIPNCGHAITDTIEYIHPFLTTGSYVSYKTAES